MFTAKKYAPGRSATDTLIGEGSVLEGSLISAASLRLEGRITGDIECAGDVIIGERGFATSNITAREVILAGRVLGNIEAAGKLTITATGSLQGNIRAAAISIEEGGVFQGMSLMEPKAPAASARTEQPEGGSATGKDKKAAKAREVALNGLNGPAPEPS
ncbi:polymer-forming cytoskeletal protein [Paenibacillus athensensis]|uniref:Cell shape determination protein CcmA n=1 Tax=Paenibacillus athensensis TaxID=1967502 RepID=A0A4Y8Q7F4_9BACL|nr:polymer-forming cytoskeletal protein [Paenibacillus athensensis]MCD1259574.1 polymer-forming cytoskeletal protein [Paenibacillus athensensis]